MIDAQNLELRLAQWEKYLDNRLVCMVVDKPNKDLYEGAFFRALQKLEAKPEDEYLILMHRYIEKYRSVLGFMK